MMVLKNLAIRIAKLTEETAVSVVRHGRGVKLFLMGLVPLISLPPSHLVAQDKMSPAIVSARQVSRRPTIAREDASRQRLWDRFEFLSRLAASAACERQAEVRQRSREAWQLASGDAAAPDPTEFEQAWKKLLEELAKDHPQALLVWDNGALSLQADPQLTLVEGLENLVILRVKNRAGQPVRLLPRLAESGRTLARPCEIGSEDEMPFLISVRQTESPLLVTWELGEQEVNLALPFQVTRPATLRIVTRDPDAGREVPSRLMVRGSDGWHRFGGPFAGSTVFSEKPELLIGVPCFYRVPFFYSSGACDLRVPPGRVTVIAQRGFEHSQVEQQIEVKADEVRELVVDIPKHFDAKQLGWISGDTHVHWVTEAWNVDLPLAELAWVQRAEDLRVINNLTLLHRTETDAFIKPSQAPMGPVPAWSDAEYHLQMAEEYRNQNLYGHLCLLNLKRLVLPIGTGPQIAGEDSLDYPINRMALLDALEQGGISIEAHGTGADHEVAVNAIYGLNHSLDQIDPRDYYDLLDCGFQLPLTNGSDHPARPIGAARAFVHVQGDFTYEKWIDGIRRGRTFTTSGPLLFLDVGGRLPGDVVVPIDAKPLQVHLHAVSRAPLGQVQVISNGEVVAETFTDQHELHLSVELPVQESRWLVARCSRNEQWNPIWEADVAHTSAVYVHVDGMPVFRDAAAARWIEGMRRHRRDIQVRGRFANPSQQQEALAYVDEALARWERRRILAEQQWRIADRIEAHRERAVALVAAVGVEGHELARLGEIRSAASFTELADQLATDTALLIQVNPEARVKMQLGSPPTRMVPHRTYRRLVRVDNEAGLRAPLRLQAWDRSSPGDTPMEQFHVSWVENGESTAFLTGARTEWKLLELRCDSPEPIEVHLSVDAGQGTQDLGFRAEVDWLIEIDSTQ